MHRWVVASVVAAGAVACGSSNVASQLAKPPEFAPEHQTKCQIRASTQKPLIVEWPSADRAELEARAKTQVVVVRYDGCEIEVLSHCRAPGAYQYTSVTPKTDTVAIRNVDELYAQVPVGAARLEGKLASAGELTVEMMMVGRLDADRPMVARDELEGRCDGATHVLSSMTVGAFEFYAGAEAEVGAHVGLGNVGAGARSASRREILTRDGSVAACVSSEDGPPADCAAMLRIEVAELGRPVARTPTCPDASTWDGTQCVATEVVTHAECPEGATWDGTRCLRPAVAVRPASAAEPATPSRQLWGDPHPGKGWFCYQGLDRGSTVGHCDREPIECGMDLGRRVEAGMSTKMQRCDPQPQAVCFEARRESDAAPRSFCYPTPALCEADHTSLDARDDVASRTDCVVYR